MLDAAPGFLGWGWQFWFCRLDASHDSPSLPSKVGGSPTAGGSDDWWFRRSGVSPQDDAAADAW